MTEKLTATFSVERITKNTIRYEETGDGPFVSRTLYLQKWAVAKLGEKSARIRITVEAIGDEEDTES